MLKKYTARVSDQSDDVVVSGASEKNALNLSKKKTRFLWRFC